jgi:nitrate reductase NapE component
MVWIMIFLGAWSILTISIMGVILWMFRDVLAPPEPDPETQKWFFEKWGKDV